MMTSIILVVSAAVVVLHTLKMIAHLNVHTWSGHRLEFTAFSASQAGMGAGAIGILLGWPPAPLIFMAGVATLIVIDRRKAR
jgi:hypothetical protein